MKTMALSLEGELHGLELRRIVMEYNPSNAVSELPESQSLVKRPYIVPNLSLLNDANSILGKNIAAVESSSSGPS